MIVNCHSRAGAAAKAGVLQLIASGKAGFDVQAGFAANGYGHSPGACSLLSALRQSGPQHRTGPVRRRLGAGATVAVLAGTTAGRRTGRCAVPGFAAA
ncbi:hypothetical protein GCM10011572_23300 [Pseudoduganella buxea]|uniref:Uncharacterized protein n=1 Tax=Pseudoduganella buxea TaxID=1949069 RepID=A0ABQ1KLM8_9BURK|nr:hypothetical protein GCM10011572_23300 [Pseudoduganella buxea]